jgi:hypothetical protein
MSFSEVQKSDFLKNLPDEIFFLDEVLIPLFTNMNQFKVIRTHGPNENGKDIVLISDGPFGNKNYTAVIVKNEPITNASTKKDKEIVATVSTQIVMCIDSGFDSIEESRKVSFNDIIVLTSQTISNSAREQLIEIAKNHRFINIHFWETKEIIKYIDDYLPEIYLVSSGTLSKYFHIVKEKCESLNELKKIAIYNDNEKHLSDVYIEPKLVSKKETIINEKTKYEYFESTLNQLLLKQGHYLITGSAGSGKSTLIRSEIYRLVLDYESKRKEILPVFIKLKTIAKCKVDCDVEEAIESYLSEEFELSIDEARYLLSKKSEIIFFLDGYDELSTKEERDRVLEILGFIEECYGCSIVVSSRKVPYGFAGNFKSYAEWEMADFSVKQISSFFDKWFKKENEKLIEDLKDHDLLDKLPNTPLVMTLIAILFESDNNVEIPSNLSELYRMFIDLLVGRWNLDRKIDSFYKANDKETFLTNIALFLHTQNKIACTEDELIEVFKETAKDLGRTFDFVLMKEELLKDTALLVLNEKSEYEFRHLSFQEYFVGTYLTVAGDIKEIIANIPHPWWNQVLYFYCGTRKINNDVLPLILETILHRPLKEKLMGLFEFGYYVQSSYKTKAAIRQELIASAIQAYAESLIELIETKADEAYKMPEIVRYLSLIEGFRIHYGSKFLSEIYGNLFNGVNMDDVDSYNKALALFILTTIIASEGKAEVLADSDRVFKQYPIIQLMEDFLIRCVLMEEFEDKKQKAIIKEQSRVILKRIKNNKELYKNILER